MNPSSTDNVRPAHASEWPAANEALEVEDLGLVGGAVDLDAELADSSFSDLLLDETELTEPGLTSVAQTKLSAAAASVKHRPRTGGITKKAGLVSFGPEDFEEGPQRDAFTIIRDHKFTLFGSLSASARVWKSIHWFFAGDDDGRTPTFDLCCAALDVRADVLRLRLHYEFFLRWWIAPKPFPFMTVPVPSLIAAEIAYICPELGRDLAFLAWTRPGIHTQTLIDELGQEAKVRRDLARLDERLMLCEQGEGHWYLTGRNPLLLRQRLILKGASPAVIGGSMHWSRMF